MRKVMKRMNVKILTIALLAALTSCDFIIVEPAYDYSDRIVGSYKVEEYSQTYNDYTHYSIYIRKSFRDQVIIEDLYVNGLDVRAEVDYDKIYINRQVINGYEIEGVGTVYGDEIDFTFKVRDLYSSNKPVDFCTATAWIY